MSDEYASLEEFDPDKLSEEDLAILRAFEAMDQWSPTQWSPSRAPQSPPASETDNETDMLQIFSEEAAEDLMHMQDALQQIQRGTVVDPSRFAILQRAGHKLHGTAGAVGFPQMSTIASAIESIAEQVIVGKIALSIGIQALTQSVAALEQLLLTLHESDQGQSEQLLVKELEDLYKELHIHIENEDTNAHYESTPATSVNEPVPDEARSTDPISNQVTPQPQSSRKGAFVHVDPQRFETLLLHTEQLVEQRTTLEHAQAEIETALQELHAAQMRLHLLEPLLLESLQKKPVISQPTFASSSSLISRILYEARQKDAPTATRTQLAHHTPGRTGAWDELDIEHYTEQDLLIHSLREAISDISTTTALVQSACRKHAQEQETYIHRVASVRHDALLMHQAPLSALVPRLQRVISTSPAQSIQFEVKGEKTEIDQDILEALASPLAQLLRTCITDLSQVQGNQGKDTGQVSRIWFHATGIGNEVTLEIGFSMAIQGGAVETLRESIQHLNGTLSLQRNTSGGISWLIHFPRSQRTAQCLLVRVGNEQLIVPFSQIAHIASWQHETPNNVYDLSVLLGLQSDFPAIEKRIRPVLVIYDRATQQQIGIHVEEVVEIIELVVRPLKAYLRRPGLVGSAIDGNGHVLLMVDLLALVHHYTSHENAPGSTRLKASTHTRRTQSTVLIADDSAYLRRAVIHLLEHAGYRVIEAHDGIEALERLLAQPPDICLLDVEMPNLNGYDVLDEMRQHPELANVKIIMLTSRSSEKHMRHARELGAHAYLTKPCEQDVLLETMKQLLR